MQVKTALGLYSGGIISQQMVNDGSQFVDLLWSRKVSRVLLWTPVYNYQRPSTPQIYLQQFHQRISQSPPRIQRFFIKLQKYGFGLEYAPGKTMVVSDALSRAYLESHSSPERKESELIHHVHSVIDSLPISTARLTRFRRRLLLTLLYNSSRTSP